MIMNFTICGTGGNLVRNRGIVEQHQWQCPVGTAGNFVHRYCLARSPSLFFVCFFSKKNKKPSMLPGLRTTVDAIADS